MVPFFSYKEIFIIKKIKAKSLGQSHLGLSIDVVEFGLADENILVLGGVHGDEVEGIEVAESIIKYFLSSELLHKKGISIISCLNPDGKVLNSRSNLRNIDLNRNLKTSNWNSVATDSRYQPGASAGSENETKIFQNYLDELRPEIIISIHSYSKSLILFHDFSKKYTQSVCSLGQNLNIPIVTKMDYSVFGSLNSLGIEKGIDIVTIECPKAEMWLTSKDSYKASIRAFIVDLL